MCCSSHVFWRQSEGLSAYTPDVLVCISRGHTTGRLGLGHTRRFFIRLFVLVPRLSPCGARLNFDGEKGAHNQTLQENGDIAMGDATFGPLLLRPRPRDWSGYMTHLRTARCDPRLMLYLYCCGRISIRRAFYQRQRIYLLNIPPGLALAHGLCWVCSHGDAVPVTYKLSHRMDIGG